MELQVVIVLLHFTFHFFTLSMEYSNAQDMDLCSYVCPPPVEHMATTKSTTQHQISTDNMITTSPLTTHSGLPKQSTVSSATIMTSSILNSNYYTKTISTTSQHQISTDKMITSSMKLHSGLPKQSTVSSATIMTSSIPNSNYDTKTISTTSQHQISTDNMITTSSMKLHSGLPKQSTVSSATIMTSSIPNSNYDTKLISTTPQHQISTANMITTSPMTTHISLPSQSADSSTTIMTSSIPLSYLNMKTVSSESTKPKLMEVENTTIVTTNEIMQPSATDQTNSSTVGEGYTTHIIKFKNTSLNENITPQSFVTSNGSMSNEPIKHTSAHIHHTTIDTTKDESLSSTAPLASFIASSSKQSVKPLATSTVASTFHSHLLMESLPPSYISEETTLSSKGTFPTTQENFSTSNSKHFTKVKMIDNTTISLNQTENYLIHSQSATTTLNPTRQKNFQKDIFKESNRQKRKVVNDITNFFTTSQTHSFVREGHAYKNQLVSAKQLKEPTTPKPDVFTNNNIKSYAPFQTALSGISTFSTHENHSVANIITTPNSYFTDVHNETDKMNLTEGISTETITATENNTSNFYLGNASLTTEQSLFSKTNTQSEKKINISSSEKHLPLTTSVTLKGGSTTLSNVNSSKKMTSYSIPEHTSTDYLQSAFYPTSTTENQQNRSTEKETSSLFFTLITQTLPNNITTNEQLHLSTTGRQTNVHTYSTISKDFYIHPTTSPLPLPTDIDCIDYCLALGRLPLNNTRPKPVTDSQQYKDEKPLWAEAKHFLSFTLSLDIKWISKYSTIDSEENLLLVIKLEKHLLPFFKSIIGLLDVRVTHLSKGSVVVSYDVSLSAFFVSSQKANIIKHLNQSLFKLSKTTNFDGIGDLTEGYMARNWLAEYQKSSKLLEDPCNADGLCPHGYVCVHTKYSISCSHMCSLHNPCKNKGICFVDNTGVTSCRCLADSKYVYYGDNCEKADEVLALKAKYIITICCVAFAVLIGISAGFICCFYKRQRGNGSYEFTNMAEMSYYYRANSDVDKLHEFYKFENEAFAEESF